KYTITKRGVSELEGLGDDGCDQIGCSTLNDEMNLVIARRDGIWYYGPEGLIAKNEFIRGRKVLIRWFKKNLVVVGIGKRILYYLVVDMNELNLIEYKLGIYDFKNSFIPFKWSSESSQQIVHVLYEWGTLLVFINQKE